MAKKALFFSPHSGIWVHAFPEALIAETLAQDGWEIAYIGCNRAFSSLCVTMSAKGIRLESPAEEKETVCADCTAKCALIRREFGFEGHDVQDVLSDEDRAEIRKRVDAVDLEKLVDYEIDGCLVGRAAMYEFLIQNKRFRIELGEFDRAYLRTALENTLKSFFVARKIVAKEKPSTILIYNTLYSVNAAWRLVADKAGIPIYFLHAGGNLAHRLNTMMIGRDSTLKFYENLLSAWPRYRDVPGKRSDYALVTDHFEELLRGRNVFAYSAPKSDDATDVRGRFGIRRDQKLLVATMSSYDEYFAAKVIGEVPDDADLLFRTQFEWIQSLANWAKDRADLFLLIRVHPREFPNKREGLKSAHASLLERVFADLPSNVRVNWPSDQISIYELAEEASLFLNAWSSAGKEMALLGLPVVVYCPTLLQYPAELGYAETELAAYFSAIDEALAEGWSFEHIRRAYRWCALEYSRSIIDLSDSVTFKEAVKPSLPVRVVRKIRRLISHTYERQDLRRRAATLKEASRLRSLIASGKRTVLDLETFSADQSIESETSAIKGELRRLVGALYPNASAPLKAGSLREKLVRALDD